MRPSLPVRRLRSAAASRRRARRRPTPPKLEATLGRLARLAVDEQRTLDLVFSQSTKLIARTLGIERVGIWLLEEGTLRCVCQYRRSTDQHGDGEVLHTADFPAYGDALEQRRAIVANDARTHPHTRQLTRVYLEPNGITSMLDAPLLRRGRVAGVVCHEHVGRRRTWTDAERTFA